jgi:hypothetical protein
MKCPTAEKNGKSTKDRVGGHVKRDMSMHKHGCTKAGSGWTPHFHKFAKKTFRRFRRRQEQAMLEDPDLFVNEVLLERQEREIASWLEYKEDMRYGLVAEEYGWHDDIDAGCESCGRYTCKCDEDYDMEMDFYDREDDWYPIGDPFAPDSGSHYTEAVMKEQDSGRSLADILIKILGAHAVESSQVVR